MIEVEHLTKRFGATTAVDDLSFTVRPGTVTGFLGPNGAGKSTAMRAIAGLVRPTSGTTRVNGRPIEEHAAPLTEIGTLLGTPAHPGRTARNHLRALAATHGLGRARVEDVLRLTGMEAVANRRVGTYSMGMAQRLGLAAALLGDPHTIMLDEPINGLDPDGIVWVRHFLRGLAAEGRTVFLSSHLMSEMAQTADHLVVIGRGRLIADAPIAELLDGVGETRVVVRTPDADRLAPALAGRGVTVTSVAAGELEVTGIDAAEIAAIARDHDVLLHELTTRTASLEEAYLSLTDAAVDYQAVPAAAAR
ncbi:ABC transporter ATP-binding protein [Agromyces mariniharenae]|uniref:ATP-binding cassette domain-containing protein n=1 Tax=Agromyces mariniharenae TaxID=2604423 RepID=A0A5S4UU11_9MICO|nr:ATP-binding cassette domain-containing protein [Agromyces mariniharenae]TYL50464.1 ATP-binding cassette domain-containing protein [Agromyces mariniharenae]